MLVFKPASFLDPALTLRQIENEFANVWTAIGGGGGGSGGGAVSSVFGRSGAVVAQSADYSFGFISGNIAVGQMAGGSGASASTFWRGDGTWSAPAGGGGTPGGSSGQLQWNSSGAFAGFGSWDGTAILEQRNGINAQSFRVYNTYTDASNYERGVFDWTTTPNTLTIGTQKAGTGTLRNTILLANFVGIAPATFAPLGPLHVVGSGGRSAWSGTVGDESFIVENNGNNTALTMAAGAQYNIIRFSKNTIVEDARILADMNNHTLTFSANQVDRWQITSTGNWVPLAGGYIQWGGQARVTSDFAVTSSIALTNVTGLSVNVQAGRTYQFEAELYVTDAAAGGVQAAIAGTATATAIQYTGYTIADNAIKAKTTAAALGTAVGSTLTTETAGIVVRITGIITVNAAGTLTVQMAQNTSNATATTAKRGSWLIVNDMP